MAGRAGAIAGLIVLSQILEDSFLTDFAVRLGDELLATAAKTGAGYSWKTHGLRNRHNLTGFSHGAAGAGSAFLELFQATGEAKYRDAASLAYDYERHWFVPDCGNWPDFREDPDSLYRRRGSRKFSIFWCHGAPGIGLSRLRAYEILGNVECKQEAIVALKTTWDTLRAALDSWAGNFSLCHGLAGNAEVLRCAADMLNIEAAEDAELASEVARYGIEQYAARNEPWPCGNHAAETPNLMLGLAGIGHFYLRQYRPSIPSILILRKEAWMREQQTPAALRFDPQRFRAVRAAGFGSETPV
jgi:lantibiotic modifying enzyme